MALLKIKLSLITLFIKSEKRKNAMCEFETQKEQR